jgi:hypothetical protein
MPPVKNSKFNPQPGSGLKGALGAVIDEVRPFLDGLLHHHYANLATVAISQCVSAVSWLPAS